MFYITQSGQIYSGDQQNNDRQLTAEEVELVKSGKFLVKELQVINIEDDEDYQKNLKIDKLNQDIEKIKSQLDELDLKSIRALREGGTNEEGIEYLTIYQNQIDELRDDLKLLLIEKNELETESSEVENDIIE